MLAGGFKLPAGGLNDPKYANMGAEAIYAKLAKDDAAKPKPQPGSGAPSPGQQGSPQAGAGQPKAQSQGQPGQGQPTPGAGAPTGQPSPDEAGEPGGFGQIRDAPGGEAGRAAAEAKSQQNTRQAAMVAKAQGAGKLPGFISEIIAELDKPRVDWRAVLRRFADESAIRETSWTRPNRRMGDSAIILPGHQSAAPAHIVTIVDTSGSMDARALAAIGGELQSMLDESAVERISVVYADTRVQRVDTAAAGDILTMKADGRGGTCFAPALAWVTENAPDASAIIYLTDLDASDLASLAEPAAPVLWAVTGGRGRAMPFGECIPIDPEE